MSDLKDILGVSRTPAAEGERPKKEKQERMKRPEGMSREAFALLGDNHPIMPSQLLSGLKKKKDDKGKARAVTKGQPTYFIQVSRLFIQLLVRMFDSVATLNGLHVVTCGFVLRNVAYSTMALSSVLAYSR